MSSNRYLPKGSNGNVLGFTITGRQCSEFWSFLENIGITSKKKTFFFNWTIFLKMSVLAIRKINKNFHWDTNFIDETCFVGLKYCSVRICTVFLDEDAVPWSGSLVLIGIASVITKAPLKKEGSSGKHFDKSTEWGAAWNCSLDLAVNYTCSGFYWHVWAL